MVYRKGELSGPQIDREWPYQVAVSAHLTSGTKHTEVLQFCAPLSLAPRGHWFRRGDTDYKVWCFAKRGDAEAFMAHFGGEIISPKERPRWPGRR